MIDLPYLTDNTVNEELIDAITNDPTTIQRYIDYVTSKVLLYIHCVSIFWTPPVYPDDLKQAVAYLVESLFISKSSSYSEVANDRMQWIKKKSVDDFSVEYIAGMQQFFFGIPVNKDCVDIIDRYKCFNQTFWYFDLQHTNC